MGSFGGISGLTNEDIFNMNATQLLIIKISVRPIKTRMNIEFIYMQLILACL